MHRAKDAQSCADQKVANPPKRKVSEQSKDAAREQQNAPRKCSNEDVTTKKPGHSRYAREDPSKITGNTLLRVQTLPGRFPPNTRYKRATRRDTSVQSTRYCVQRRTTVCENQFAKTTMFLSVAPRSSFPWQFLSLHHDVLFHVLEDHDALSVVTRSWSFYYIHGVACDVFVDPFKVPRYGGVTMRSSRYGGVTKRSSRYEGLHSARQDMGVVPKRPFQQDLTAKSKHCEQTHCENNRLR